MGIQMMGSQGNGQQSQFQPLARQSSLYNLTLDEVQNQLGDLGKPLSSMNLDELLKNVWSVEVNPVMGMDTENSALPGPVSSASGLHRQGSMTLTQALSKKTVDEVWRDIQQGQSKGREERRDKERQPTLGEMTLEDFLMKAGIVAEERKKKGEGDPQNLEGISNVGSVLGADPMVGPQNFSQHPPWMQQYQLPLLHQQQHQQPQHQQQNIMGTYMAGRPVSQPLGVGGDAGPLLDVAYPENQMGMSSPLMGTLSDTQTPGRKRVAPGNVVEKTVERRQKRMIKNRESAARSRARKQAYTNELENKVSRLEEENERLKKQKLVWSRYVDVWKRTVTCMRNSNPLVAATVVQHKTQCGPVSSHCMQVWVRSTSNEGIYMVGSIGCLQVRVPIDSPTAGGTYPKWQPHLITDFQGKWKRYCAVHLLQSQSTSSEEQVQPLSNCVNMQFCRFGWGGFLNFASCWVVFG